MSETETTPFRTPHASSEFAPHEIAASNSAPPQISIVLATFDRPLALARCLHALVCQQTPHTFEIIVVDNHPQSAITTPLMPQFPSIRWLQDPIAGLSQARNTGIAAARGAILVTTDDDVLPPPTWLQTLTAPLFDDDLTLAATTGNCLPLKVETPAEILFEAYGGLRHGATPTTFDAAWLSTWRLTFPQLWRIGTTANAAFRLSALQQIGPFDTLLGAGTPAGAWEDLYAFYLLLRAGFRIRYLPEAAVLHEHRTDLTALTRQLLAYRRGETAFLTLMFARHRDFRTWGQLLLWIPQWRFRLFAEEALRRLRGHRQFPFYLLIRETLAYLSGPGALWRTRHESPPVDSTMK